MAPKANAPTHPETQAFDKVILDFMETNGLVGASVGVSLNGTLKYTQGYGYANKDTQALALPESRYRIASISKTITAVTILKLAESGNPLELSSKVFGPNGLLSSYKPLEGQRMADHLEDITVTHLLQHTAGWNRCTATNPFTNGEGFDPMFASDPIAQSTGTQAPASPAAIVRYMLSQPLQATPGTAYAYSNFGYCVLGRIIEHATGQRYIDYIRNSILHNMGLTHTTQACTELSKVQTNEVHYYPDTDRVTSVFPDGGQVPQPYGGFYIEAMDSPGGWLSTVGDLLIRMSISIRWSGMPSIR